VGASSVPVGLAEICWWRWCQTGRARILWKIETEIGVWRGEEGRNKQTEIHDALRGRETVIGGNGFRTYQRVWPLVMAHSNGVPFLLFEAARRFVRAHASFMRSSTVSANWLVSKAASHSFTPGFPVFCPTSMLARHVSANVEAGSAQLNRIS
jgi:hypothetical protein